MTPTNEAGHGLPELPEPEELLHSPMHGHVYGYTAKQVQRYAIDYAAALALSRGVPETGSWLAADDVYRHARTIDVALNGEDGAASRPALCDVVSQIASLARQHGPLAAALAAPAAAGAQGEGDTSRPGMSYWAVQLPGKMPKLYGAYAFAELNWYPDEGGALVRLQEVERIGDSTTPQPAAADGGVRERAREILIQALQDGGAEETARIMRICDDRDDWWAAFAIRAIADALSSHRQAGDDQDG